MLNILGYGSANQSTQSKTTSNLSLGGGTSGGQLSPFAQMLSELQQLEQGNPKQYAKVSQQISTNLSAAASSAQTQGNSSLASQLTTLSKDFATASQTGQLPNMGDLAKAIQGGHQHHIRAGSSDSDSDSNGTGTNAAVASSTAGTHGVMSIIGQVLNLTGV
jgi:hypothetical protein